MREWRTWYSPTILAGFTNCNLLDQACLGDCLWPLRHYEQKPRHRRIPRQGENHRKVSR